MRSIAALVMLGVIGGGGEVFGRCRRCVLLSNLSVGWCGNLDMLAKCLLRRCDCSLGEGIVLLFVVMAKRCPQGRTLLLRSSFVPRGKICPGGKLQTVLLRVAFLTRGEIGS